MDSSLLATKLYIPPRRTGSVPRPVLTRRLEEGRQAGARLTLISTPAGYGKTSLALEWIENTRLPAAWYSLDESDSDPKRFLTYLIEAFGRLQPGIGRHASHLLNLPQPLEAAAVLSPLINELTVLADPYLIVLDDYHLIHSQPVHSAVAFLLEHLPPNGHLAILTRADPPLPVARLRGRGQVTELRLQDLQFTDAEAASFLQIPLGDSLSPRDAAAINHRTEGWAAGLQMTALALQSRLAARPEADISSFVQSFSGSDRYIVEYLGEEVLQGQSEPVQDFLIKTSLLKRLCGPLCDAMLSEGESRSFDGVSGQETLEFLEGANLFLIPLDNQRRWYRYHALFADLLQNRLHRFGVEREADLHRKACSWFESNGFPEDAIEHALAAGDYQTAARLISLVAEPTLMHGELSIFMRWAEKIPAEMLKTYPKLGVYYAWGLLVDGRANTEIESRLSDLETGHTEVSVLCAPVRSYISLVDGNSARAVELARFALKNLPDGEQLLQSLAMLSLAGAHLAEYRTEEGLRILNEAGRISQQAGNVMVSILTLINQGALAWRNGSLSKAERSYRQALELASDGQGHFLPVAARALSGLGELAYERNDLILARDLLDQAVKLSKEWSQAASVFTFLPLARLRQSDGDLAGAQAAIDQARLAAAASLSTRMDDLMVDLAQARLWLVSNELQQVEHWAAERQVEVVPVPDEQLKGDAANLAHMWKYEVLVLARLRLVQGQPTDALSLLDNVHPVFSALQRVRAVIETEVLRAWALDGLRRPEAAVSALDKALRLAEPEGFARVFLDEGESVISLLRANRRGIDPSLQDYLDRLLAATPIQVSTAEHVRLTDAARPDRLSERELEVLRLLSSPLTIEEIASRLYISVATVRSHIKSIYSKLGIHSRIEAAALAKRFNAS